MDYPGKPGRKRTGRGINAVGFPARPTDLDPIALATWRRYEKQFTEMGIGNVDAEALRGFCTSYSLWRRMEKILNREGYTYANAQGMMYRRPEVDILLRAKTSMLSYARDLGLTPFGRTRIPRGEIKAEEDEMLLRKANLS